MKVNNLLVVVTHFWAPNKHVKNKKRKYKKLKKNIEENKKYISEENMENA